MKMNNSALLSLVTCKNLDNMLVKSAGGEEIAWQNQT